jgi:hypothetical protein
MAEPALKLSFKLNGDDFRGFIKESDKNTRSFSYIFLAFILFALTVAAFMFMVEYIGQINLEPLTTYAIVASQTLLLAGLYLIVTRWLRRTLQARRVRKSPSVMRPMSFEIGATGLSTDDGLSNSWYDWKAFERVELTADSVLLVLDPLRAVIVPRRVLGDQENVLKFKQHIEAFMSAARRG